MVFGMKQVVVTAALGCACAVVGCDFFMSLDDLSAGGTRPPDGGGADGTVDGTGEGGTNPSGAAYLVVAGGGTPDPVDNVWIARIEANGDLGPWNPGPPLPTTNARGQLVARGGQAILVGGTSFSASKPFLYASSLADGQLAPWVTPATTLPASSTRHGAFVAQGRLYSTGGWAGTSEPTTVADVWVSAFDANGALGSFSAGLKLPEPRHGHAALSNGTYAWIIAGNAYVGGNSLKRIDGWVGTVQSDGAIQSWRPLTRLAGNVTANAGAALTSTHVYLSGGYSSARSDQVRGAQIQPDGTLAEWFDVASLRTGRATHKMVHARGRLYVISGQADSREALASVEVADILPDNTLSPWREARPLPVPLIAAAADVLQN